MAEFATGLELQINFVPSKPKPSTFELWSFPDRLALRVLVDDAPIMLSITEPDAKHLRDLLLARYPKE
jgi:hypothetical protein